MVGEDMEIKDAIMQTLVEIDELVYNQDRQDTNKQKDTNRQIPRQQPKNKKQIKASTTKSSKRLTVDEMEYLKSIRERMLVLFEGLQSPQNKNLEDKLELTLNFLEYTLATIDERLSESIKETKKANR
jgi:hypothetical protein